ncbi:hypothetical protein ACHAWF_014381 [Thalassiosira exigua]
MRARTALLAALAASSSSISPVRGAFVDRSPPPPPSSPSVASDRAGRSPRVARSTGADWSLRWKWGGESPVDPSGGSDGDGAAVVPAAAAELSEVGEEEEEAIEAIPGVWSRLRYLRERRKARSARRKLRRARKRFETRRKMFDGGAAAASWDAIGDDDDDEEEGWDDDEGVDDHCFLLPGWRDDEGGSEASDDDAFHSVDAACRDQSPFASGEIERMPYVHGGFFGAAPFMLANPRWTSILRALTPDVYVEVSRRASRAPAPRLIHWAENNPVVAAYGTAHELEFNGEMPVLEWDVFLDPRLVRGLKKALSEKEARSRRREDGGASIDAAADRRTSADCDEEIERRTTRLVEGMLVAHGNTRQIITEQTPFKVLKKLNFASVKRTRKSLGGGMFAREWLAVYSDAVRMGMDRVDDDDDGDEFSGRATDVNLEDQGAFGQDLEIRDLPRDEATEASDGVDVTSSQGVSASVDRGKSIRESISELPAPIRLLLDLKSRHVSRRVWALVIDHLRGAGAEVEGIASFNVAEMRDTSRYCSSPVNEIFFLHSCGDLQHCCHSGQLRKGDRVFFNAGSLFWDARNSDVVKSILRRGSPQPRFDKSGNPGYRLKPYAKTKDVPSTILSGSEFLPHGRDSTNDTFAYLPDSVFAPEHGGASTIQDYKDYYQLSIGLYVQECAIDDATLSLIVNYVNTNSHVFDLGLSWGGINGLTVKGIQQTRFSITDGKFTRSSKGSHSC